MSPSIHRLFSPQIVCAWAILFGASLQLHAQRADFSIDQVLGENVFMYMTLEDMPRSMERFNDSPMAKIRDDKEFAELREFFGEAMREDMEDEEDFDEGLKYMKGFMSQIDGPVGFAFTDPEPMMALVRRGLDESDAPFVLPDDLLDPNADPDSIEELDFDEDEEAEVQALVGSMVFIAKVKGAKEMNTFMEEFIAQGNEQEQESGTEDPIEMELTTKKMEGRTFHLLEQVDPDEDDAMQITLTWTYADDYAIMGFTPETLAGIAKNLDKGGARDPLATHESFSRIRGSLEESDGMFYFNPAAIMAFAEDLMMENSDGLPGGMNMQKIQDALQLKTMSPIGINFKMLEEGLKLRSEYGFDKETKLTKLMMPLMNKAPLREDWVPKSAMGAASYRIDMADWIDDIIALAMELSPQAGMAIGAGRMMAKGQTGIDPVDDFSKHLGDSLTILSFLPEMDAQELEELEDPLASSPMVIGFKLKDIDAIRNNMDKMMTKMGVQDMVEENDFNGTPIFSFAGGAVGLEYAFVDGNLLLCLGPNKNLRACLRAMENPKKNFWRDRTFRQAVKMLPANPVSLSYSKTAGLFNLFQSAFEQAGEEIDLGPLEEVFGNSISGSYKEGGRIVSEQLLLYAED